MLNTPVILNTPDFMDASINYKWNSSSYSYFNSEVENLTLGNLFEELSYKATMAFSAALTEWIFWRFYHMGQSMGLDLTLQQNAIESVWAGAIDNSYTTNWEVTGLYRDFIADDKKDSLIAEALYISSRLMSRVNKRCRKGLPLIWTDMDKLAMLARHISPDVKSFDEWLTSYLEHAITLFPADYATNPINKNDSIYDTAIDIPVVRDFFFTPDFDYINADIPSVINQFLNTLCWKKNNLLNSPEKMIEQGFRGTPYQYTK